MIEFGPLENYERDFPSFFRSAIEPRIESLEAQRKQLLGWIYAGLSLTVLATFSCWVMVYLSEHGVVSGPAWMWFVASLTIAGLGYLISMAPRNAFERAAGGTISSLVQEFFHGSGKSSAEDPTRPSEKINIVRFVRTGMFGCSTGSSDTRNYYEGVYRGFGYQLSSASIVFGTVPGSQPMEKGQHANFRGVLVAINLPEKPGFEALFGHDRNSNSLDYFGRSSNRFPDRKSDKFFKHLAAFGRVRFGHAEFDSHFTTFTEDAGALKKFADTSFRENLLGISEAFASGNLVAAIDRDGLLLAIPGSIDMYFRGSVFTPIISQIPSFRRLLTEFGTAHGVIDCLLGDHPRRDSFYPSFS